GMADVDRVLQVEHLDELREVVGVRVHVVAGPRLARTAVAAAVVGDAAVPARGQVEHLVFPGIRAERPAVAEDDGWAAAPVLVVDRRAVLRGDRAHRPVSSRNSRTCRAYVASGRRGDRINRSPSRRGSARLLPRTIPERGRGTTKSINWSLSFCSSV